MRLEQLGQKKAKKLLQVRVDKSLYESAKKIMQERGVTTKEAIEWLFERIIVLRGKGKW